MRHPNAAGLSPWWDKYGLEPSESQRLSSAPPYPMSPLAWTLPQIHERGDHAGLPRLSFTLSATMGWQRSTDLNCLCGCQRPVCYLLHQTAVCRVSAPAHTLSEWVPVFADCQLIHTRHNYALWMTLKTTSSWVSPPPPARFETDESTILSPKVHACFSQRLT